MPSVTSYFKRIPPAEILEKVTVLAHKYDINLSITYAESDEAVSCGNKEEFQKKIDFFKEMSFLSPHFFLSIPHVTINMRYENFIYKVDIKQQDNTDKTYFFNLLKSFNEIFPVSEPIQLVRQYLSEEEKKLIESREISLSALQSASENILTGATANIQKWNDKFLEFQGNLQKQYEVKEESLTQKIKNEEAELENKKKEFQEEKKAFDDRERTIVRRELLKDIKKIIEENKTVEVSEKTRMKRWPVAHMFFILLVISVFLGGTFAFYSIKFNNLMLLFPFSSCLLIFLTTSIFYIKWQNQWAKVHADAEFANKKFETDMLRASWLTEMYFEWDDKKTVAFPQQMVDSFTKELFTSSSPIRAVTHPVEDLLKYANKFSKIKVTKDGIEAEKKSIEN